jgi:GAF domain-containing protein
VAFAADEDTCGCCATWASGSILIVPLVAGWQSLGALTLVRSDPVRRFTPSDVELAEELGQRAGIAVLNAAAVHERATIARELQAGLMPPAARRGARPRRGDALPAGGRAQRRGRGLLRRVRDAPRLG